MILGCAAAALFREPEIQQLYNTTRGRDDVRWFEVSMDDPFCGPCAGLHLHDVGHQDGIDFLVLECLEGETLAERLRAGALLLGWSAFCMCSTCSAAIWIRLLRCLQRERIAQMKPGGRKLARNRPTEWRY